MGLINLALNNLMRRKSKTAFLIIGMIIGITTVIALYTINSAMQSEISNRFDQIGSNILIVPKSDQLNLTYGGVSVKGVEFESKALKTDSLSKIITIKNKDNIAVVAPKLLTSERINSVQALVMGVMFDRELRMKKWWKINTNPDNPNEFVERTYELEVGKNQILLGHNLAQEFQTQPGEDVEIFGTMYNVAGVIDRVGSEEDNAILMDLSVLQEKLNKEDNISLIEVSALCNTCPIEDIVEQLQSKLPNAKVTAIKEVVNARKQVIDGFTSFSLAVSIIVLFIGCTVVFITMSSSVHDRVIEIGILRAIGFRSSHIFQVILLEVLLASGFSGIIGYLLGIILAKFIAPLVAQMDVIVSWQPVLALGSLGLSLLLGILSSFIPGRRASRLDPVEALRHV